MKPRFFYLIPTIGWGRFNGETTLKYLKRLATGNRQPSGGVQVIYQHCDILNRNGIEAFPVNLGASWNSFRPDWFAHKSEPISAEQARGIMAETDVIICPEVIPGAVLDFPVGEKVLFVQNWALVKEVDFNSLFTSILTVSPFCTKFMQEKTELPTFCVTNGIDLNLFKPAPGKRTPNRGLFWGRKNREDGLRAIEMLPPGVRAETKFIEASNSLTQVEISELYQEADVFMALGYPEGFALPPLEAMACGCMVVGFTGGGGGIHMIDAKTALVAPDGNVDELALILERALTNTEVKEKIRNGGQKKAQEFTPERMERELIAFVKKQGTEAQRQ